MNKQVQWLVVAVALTVMVVLPAGCGGSSNTGDSGSSDLSPSVNLLDQTEVDSANTERLDEANNANAYTVQGVFSIDGLTLLDSTGEPVAAEDALPELDARLLDPEEDILAALTPSQDGSFTLAYTTPTTTTGSLTASRAGTVEASEDNAGSDATTESTLLTTQLTVTLRVEEDLDGDGEGGDTVALAVPLSLLPGRVVTAQLNISYGDSRYVDPALVPEAGWFVLADFHAEDADGLKEKTYGVFYADRTTVCDVDLNGVLQITDYQGADDDLNGIVDVFEEPAGSSALTLALQGQITAVSPTNLTITVRTSSRVKYLLQLQQFTPLELWDVSGNPVGSLPLSTELIGRWITVEGNYDGVALTPWQVVAYAGVS